MISSTHRVLQPGFVVVGVGLDPHPELVGLEGRLHEDLVVAFLVSLGAVAEVLGRHAKDLLGNLLHTNKLKPSGTNLK